MSPSLYPHPDNGATTSLPPEPGRGDGHDPRGRFTTGNRCGQGNPATRQTAAFRQALRAAVSVDDVTAIAGKLRELALGGNLAAIRLLLSYVVGRPGAEDEEETDEEPPTPTPDPPAPTEDAVPVPAESTVAPAPDVPPAGNSLARQQTEADPEMREREAPRPPSATVDNGRETARPPSATVDNGEQPPRWAIRRWPR